MSRVSLAAGSGPAAGLGIPPALATPAFLLPLGDAAGLAEVSRRQEARAPSAPSLAVPDGQTDVSICRCGRWVLVATATPAAHGASARCVLCVCVSEVPASAGQVCPHTKLFLGWGCQEGGSAQAAAGGGCHHVPGGGTVARWRVLLAGCGHPPLPLSLLLGETLGC